MTSQHIAIILAAGGSTRLGRPKQLLTRDGETLVHRAARLAIETGALRTLVVLGADHEPIAAALADLTCDIVINAAWQRGLGSSIAVAGRHIGTHVGQVLISVCDQPALERRHFDALLAGAVLASRGVAATRHGEALGVPAVVPGAWLAAPHDDAALAGDRGFSTRIASLARDALIVLDEPCLLDDIDTQDDLEHAIARGVLDGLPH